MISNKHSWNRLSEKYEKAVRISVTDVHYGPNGPGDKSLDLFGAVSGKRVIDLGCGGGQNSIALAKRGALVTAVDFSKRQLMLAERAASREGTVLELRNDNIQDLSSIGDSTFDIAFSCFASEYVKKLDTFFRNVFRVLRPDGFLILCDLHPFASGAAANARSRDRFFASLRYFEAGPREFRWSGSGNLAFRRYHRRLEDVFSSLRANALCVVDMREPRVEKRSSSQEYPYFDPDVARRDDLWAIVPYTIVMKIRRLLEA